ncbi:Acetyl-CoA hydrolase [Wickerhamiella sorbophila]|uniref:Acetyl-CoA hydrolase n=1 Tax=Wickerhamiella sorbophila TaxID=45607 RepID=A0A2T0FGU9_9ASCO|nr:Acetyl-CoA hydrolase [Wickerhamiella sorbophila]PRT54214.1 Acetyl-CoA hydrolase [Wickerhamiella sorbophila]
MSAILKSRIKNPALLNKLRTVEEVVPFFENDMYMGWSGFTGVGGPKVVPVALADHVEKNKLQNKLRFTLITGASTDTDVEGRWASLGMLKRRTPHQVGKPIQKVINEGSTLFFDKHLSMVPQDLCYGFYTKDRADPARRNSIDVALVEATGIDENGQIILGPSVGAAPELVAYADKVIIEINTSIPSFYGLHDIQMPENPPFRTPFPVTSVTDRFGTPGIPVNPDKILAIIESDARDSVPDNTPSDAMSQAIANHLVHFFQNEVKQGRMPENLLPLQSGIGNIANAVVEGLASSSFENLNVWTEVFQDSFLDFLENGKLNFATSTSVRLTQAGFKRFFANFDEFKQKILLRSQYISNHPEIIRRLGVIAMNTPVEVDIYGQANSTCVNGSRMLNGLGGSGDFLRNAKLSIMHTPSARPTKTDPTGISCIVPMATHVDHTEHDLDVVVTDQGLADLRGLAPRERSRAIIKNCAHPDFKDQLLDYVEFAENYCTKTRSLHEPQVLSSVFKMQANLAENGTMKLKSW